MRSPIRVARIAPRLALLFLALHAPATAHAAGVDLNLHPLSYRFLHGDESYRVPHENQTAFGGTVNVGTTASHLRAAFGLFLGKGSGDFSSFTFEGTQRSTTFEFSIGLSGEWRTRDSFRGYFGGGVSLVTVRLEREEQQETDECRGMWLEGGVAWRLGPHLSLGIGARALAGTEVNAEFGPRFTADYWQVGPLLGWSWPARS